MAKARTAKQRAACHNRIFVTNSYGKTSVRRRRT